MNGFRLLLLLTLCGPAFAQTDAITVTASRTIDLSPDQIVFTLAVITEPTVTLNQVLEATQSIGLDASKLSTINVQQSYGPGSPRPTLSYVFFLSTTLAKFSETNDKVTSLRRALADQAPPMDAQMYGITVAPSDGSLDQARQALMPQLVSDARRRGDLLARAAGVTLGAITGVTELVGPELSSAYYGPYGPAGPSTLHSTYSLSVRFAVK
jgi:Protein of unknown function (DUF541)